MYAATLCVLLMCFACGFETPHDRTFCFALRARSGDAGSGDGRNGKVRCPHLMSSLPPPPPPHAKCALAGDPRDGTHFIFVRLQRMEILYEPYTILAVRVSLAARECISAWFNYAIVTTTSRALLKAFRAGPALNWGAWGRGKIRND